MAITPLNDRILLKRVASEEKTAGGIIIPDTAKEKPQEGEIIAVGPGKLGDKGDRVTPTVKVGDRVLFGKYSGTEVNYGGEEYVLLREDDIFAVIS
jgi:chaperonin GroES